LGSFRELPVEDDEDVQAEIWALSAEIQALENEAALFEVPVWGVFENYLFGEETALVESLIAGHGVPEFIRGQIAAFRSMRERPAKVRSAIASKRESLSRLTEGEENADGDG
jgi:hypothetical protein